MQRPRLGDDLGDLVAVNGLLHRETFSQNSDGLQNIQAAKVAKIRSDKLNVRTCRSIDHAFRSDLGALGGLAVDPPSTRA